MSLDFNTLAFQDFATLHLTHPATDELLYSDDEQKKPITIDVYSKTSKVYRKWMTESKRKNEARKNKPLTDLAEAEDTANWLSSITKSISNISLSDNKLVCFEDYHAFYLLPQFSWVAEQIVMFLRSSESFLKV